MKKKSNVYSKKKRKKQEVKKITIFLFFVVFFLILVLAAIFIKKSGVRIPFFPNTGNTPYVSTNGTALIVNGESYQFTGVNAFSLGTYAGSNAGCGGQENNLDAFFSKLRPNSMVRMWAFQGSITTNVTTKKTDWSGLDRVVNAAQKDGVKLILVLGDQSGTCDDGHWKDRSWYEGGYTQVFNDLGNGLTPLPYLDYVKLVVSRYKDSTAVAMWEPINEPEADDCQDAKGSACYSKQKCSDEDAAKKALRSFFDTVGGEIKSVDKNHLVSSGVIGEGQCGAVFEDYQYIHESPGIDVASYHDYGNEDQAMPGDQWNGLQKRLNQMKLINKPLIVGEIGMQAMDNSTNCISYATRRDKLKAKMDAQFKAGIAGFIPWDLTGGVSNICNFDIVNNDPAISLLHNYPVSMGAFQDSLAPTTPTDLTATNISTTQATFIWSASTDNVGVTRYDIFRNDNFFTSTTETSVTVTNLTPSTTYTFFVKAKDAAQNNSDSSNRVLVTTASDTQAPTAPTDLTASAVASTQATLTWTPSTDNVGVTRYDIFLNDNYFTSITDTHFTITGLIPGSTYTYFVKSKDAAQNNSDSSNRVTVSTSSAKP